MNKDEFSTVLGLGYYLRDMQWRLENVHCSLRLLAEEDFTDSMTKEESEELERIIEALHKIRRDLNCGAVIGEIEKIREEG